MVKSISHKYSRQSRIYEVVNFIVVLLIIMIADNPIVVYNKLFGLLVFGIVLLLFIYRKKKFDFQVLAVIAVVFFVILLQGYRWGISYFTFITYTIYKVLIPYMAIKVVGIKYLRITSEIVYYSAIISLVLFFGQVAIPGFTASLFNIESFFRPISSLPVRPSILIYSIAMQVVEEGGMTSFLRNPGMFHEPGAFGVFIVLSIVINIMIDDHPFSKKNMLLLLALLTTFSTAAYISIILVYIIYFYFIKKTNIRLALLASIFLVPILIYVAQLPFMLGKIEEKVINETEVSINTPTAGRILGARKALVVLSRYPFTGRGMISASRETDDSSDERAGYGFMKFFSEMGIVLSLIFLYYFIKGMKRISYYFSGKISLWLIMGVCLLFNLFSQKFIADAFFLMFLFIGVLKEFSFKNTFNIKMVKSDSTFSRNIST